MDFRDIVCQQKSPFLFFLLAVVELDSNQELMMFVSLNVTDFRLQLQFQRGMPLLGMFDRQLT